MAIDGFDDINLLSQPSPILDEESDNDEVNENIENSKIYLDIMVSNCIFTIYIVI